jgi:hypothetical protein
VRPEVAEALNLAVTRYMSRRPPSGGPQYVPLGGGSNAQQGAFSHRTRLSRYRDEKGHLSERMVAYWSIVLGRAIPSTSI